MKRYHHPAVIGGTGKSGKYLVEYLVSQGLQFNMLVRNPAHLDSIPPGATIVHGNVLVYEDVLRSFQGCDAVISTLGMGIPPGDPDLFSKATGHILHALETCGISRYICTTGLNVDTPTDRKGEITAAATAWMYSHFPASTADRQLEHDLLAASTADWTQVRLPRILQTADRSEIIVSPDDCPGEQISAANLAAFLTGLLDTGEYSREAPFIADKR